MHASVYDAYAWSFTLWWNYTDTRTCTTVRLFVNFIINRKKKVKDCTFTKWKESYVSDSSSEKSHYESNELESIPVTQISANQINRSDQIQQNAIQYMQRKTPSIQSAFGSNKTRNQTKCIILFDIWGMVDLRIKKELKYNFKTPIRY